jgi:hypothetical protein
VCHGGVVMTVAVTMASVFTTQTLVRVPQGAGRPVAGQETDWPPMAWASECCQRSDFSEGGQHRVDTGAAVSVVPFCGRPATATAYLTGPDNKVIPAPALFRRQIVFW